MKGCSVEGCGERKFVRQWCRKHYDLLRKIGTFGLNRCLHINCTGFGTSLGLCSAHYKQQCAVGGFGAEHATRQIYVQYKNSARRNGREFELKIERLRELIEAPCHYCGWADKRNGDVFTRNGIDRVDNTKGYTKTNVVTCCQWCNYAKRSKLEHDFLAYLNQITFHIMLGTKD